MKWGVCLLGDTHRTQLWRVYANISAVAFIAGLWLCEIPSTVSLLCVLTFILHCTVLPKDWGSMKWGNGLLIIYIFPTSSSELSDSKTSTQYCFSLGIVLNTHRLTINVSQFTGVSESRNKSYDANFLWVSLSRLITHVIDPQSIGKAVQISKNAPNTILKFNTYSVISTDLCQINKLLSFVDFIWQHFNLV